MMIRILFICSLLLSACTKKAPDEEASYPNQYISILGIAQDAGFPQADCTKENCQRYWNGEVDRRMVVSLGLTDQTTGQNWIFEATPDFPAQLHHLKEISKSDQLTGVFITHAHIGHYTGLMYLGHESMGAKKIPVYSMPRMKTYLETNGPWSQLVTLNNIELQPLAADSSIQLNKQLSVTPILVPHRDEYSETVGYRIETSTKKVLFIPDINKWKVWERDIVDEIAKVDVALLDATFYDSKELPGRNMSDIPHPYVEESIELFKGLPASEKNKVLFIHFNHTNPLMLNGPERQRVESQGFQVASEEQIIPLN